MAVGETGHSLKCCAWTCGAGGHRHRGMLLIFCALCIDAKSMLFWTLILLAAQEHWHATSIIMIHFTLHSFHSFYFSRDFPGVLKLYIKFKDMHISTQVLLYPSLTSKGGSFHSVKMLHIPSKCWSVKWECLIVNNKMQQRGCLREVFSETKLCKTKQKENRPASYTWSLSWCSLPQYFSNSSKWWLHLQIKLCQVRHSWGEMLQGNHGVSHSC